MFLRSGSPCKKKSDWLAERKMMCVWGEGGFTAGHQRGQSYLVEK